MRRDSQSFQRSSKDSHCPRVMLLATDLYCEVRLTPAEVCELIYRASTFLKMSGIIDGFGQNQDVGHEISSKSGMSQQNEIEASKVCWKRHKGMQENPNLVLRSETCSLPEKQCIRSSQCLSTFQANQNERVEWLEDQDSVREEAGSSGAGANAGLITPYMPCMVKESSMCMPGDGPEETKHSGLLLENKAAYAEKRLLEGDGPFCAEKDYLKAMGHFVNLEMLGDKNKVAFTVVKLGGIGGQTSRPSEQGLGLGMGSGMHKMPDCVPPKQQTDAGCTLFSVLGNAEILRSHKLQVNKFDKERAPPEGKFNAVDAPTDHEWRQGGDSQNSPQVKHPDTGFSFFELDEARRDMVAQAHDRWSSLGLRQYFLPLPISNDRRQSPNGPSTILIDAVPLAGPQVSLPSEPESLPLMPGSSEDGISPPCTSMSHSSEERNTICSTHGQPVMCVAATICTAAEVVAITGSNINFNQVKSSALARTCEEECKVETINKVVPETCHAPAESTSNNLPCWVKPLGEDKKCDATPQNGSGGAEQHQSFSSDSVVKDCDQVSQLNFFRNADSSMQVIRHHNSMWISRFSSRHLPTGSDHKHYPQVHVGQGHVVGKDRTDEAGINTEQGGQLGLTMRETDFIISQSDYQEKPVDSNASSTYILSKRSNSNLGKWLQVERGRTDKGPADPAYTEYPTRASSYAYGDASDGGSIGQDSADFTATMICVKDWTIKYAEYMAASHKKEGPNSAPSICIFCGLHGHTVSECSETSNSELHDLDRRLHILHRLSAQTNAIYCLRCLGEGHWGAECQLKELEASSTSQMKDSKLPKEGHVEHYECQRSRQNTAFDKRNLSTGGSSFTADQLRACVTIPISVEKCSSKTLPSAWGMHNANNIEETNNQQGSCSRLQKVPCRNSDLKGKGQFHPTEHRKWKCKFADSEGKSVANMIAVRPMNLLVRDDKSLNDWQFGLAIPAAKVQNETKWGTPLVPTGILEMIESIRLSRADLFKWASHADINLSVQGFFVRLRFGKWEKELGGTGYRMACVRGAFLEASVGARKLSMLVDLGNMECTVDSQYVSNQGFTEAELAEWWQATRLSGKSVPQKGDLKAKHEERQAWI